MLRWAVAATIGAASAWANAGTPPANDDCANAIPLTSGVEVIADNTNATTDGPTESLCPDGLENDLW